MKRGHWWAFAARAPKNHYFGEDELGHIHLD
jgi:hypothetical protein